jgi:hypothetical protein
MVGFLRCAMGKGLFSLQIALNVAPPNKLHPYSHSSCLVWICAGLIRFCLKVTEETFQPMRRLEVDESNVE